MGRYYDLSRFEPVSRFEPTRPKVFLPICTFW